MASSLYFSERHGADASPTIMAATTVDMLMRPRHSLTYENYNSTL
jgi:hypothetical protein